MSDRALDLLRCAFVADSLTMPAHWFYNTRHLDAALPAGCAQLQAAPPRHPDAIMSLHATNAGGRRALAAKGDEVVGSVILKGRAQLWNRPGLHYHHGMQAGDNTLNAHVALWLLEELARAPYSAQVFLTRYERDMTADPPGHPDTYAESYHRAFFANRQRGLPLDRCAGHTHDTPSVGGLVLLAPLAVAGRLRGDTIERLLDDARTQLFLTHPDEGLAAVAERYVRLLMQLLDLEEGDSDGAREALLSACPSARRQDVARWSAGSIPVRQVIGQHLSSACYIRDAWPAVLFLALRFLDAPMRGLQENALAGGDNVHRGWVLASLLGGVHGDFAQTLYQQLSEKSRIEAALTELSDAASS